jgi:hypothetical protein
MQANQVNDSITRALTVVDLSLREVFPNNYWKRCTYAAFGLNRLLSQGGIASEFVSGDILCFTLSTDGRTPLLEGYGNAAGGGPSHYWIEAEGALLDLGAHYLPMEARRPIVPMPVIRWDAKEPLPRYLRYRELARAPAMQPEATIAEKVHGFVQHCELRDRRLGDDLTMPHWALTGPASLDAAAVG